jgi:hypothetical protein
MPEKIIGKRKSSRIGKKLKVLRKIRDLETVIKSLFIREKWKKIDLQGMHRKVRKKRSFNNIQIEEDLPKERYPEIDKNNIEINICNIKGKVVFSCNKIENKGVELFVVCNKRFSKITLRFVRHLQNVDLQSLLLFKNLKSGGKNRRINDSNDVENCPSKFEFHDLKRMKENEADLENVFKKRRIKISSMEDDMPTNGYPKKSQYGFKGREKIIYLESNDVESNIKYSKVGGKVKINAPENAVHEKLSLLQFDNTNLECREFLMNNWIDGLMNFSKLEFKRITKSGQSKENFDFIPGWMARSKHLIRGDESKFTKNWKFKKNVDESKFTRKWKFRKKFAA